MSKDSIIKRAPTFVALEYSIVERRALLGLRNGAAMSHEHNTNEKSPAALPRTSSAHTDAP